MDKNSERFKSAKFIFVVGIGGSDLAGKAVWNAMTLHKPEISKKIFFIESLDSREDENIKNLIEKEISNLEDAVLVAVSKSGKTAETLEAFNKIFAKLSEKFGVEAKNQAVVISSPETPLWKIAEEKEMKCLPWEGDIGGRFSAFTVAHTFILEIAGIKVDEFVRGGREAEMDKSLAQNLANKISENYKKGFGILDFFIFNEELEDLGKWCRQLIAESLGKENKKGEKVGIMPVVSIGPTDLHSMLQLNLGGPKNKFTLFIRSLKEIEGGIGNSAYEDTVKAYEREVLPFEKYEMPEINEYELGKFMGVLMHATVELANLLEVNPFDQPAVEEYKSHLTHNN